MFIKSFQVTTILGFHFGTLLPGLNFNGKKKINKNPALVKNNFFHEKSSSEHI